MPGGIEDTILNNISSQTGDTFEDSVPDLDESTTPDLEQDQVEHQLGQREAEEQQPKEPSKTETKLPVKDEKVAQPKQGPDKSHNKEFAERRLQTTLDRTRQQVDVLTKQNQDLVNQVAGVKALNGIPQQFGLSNDEVLGGLEYVSLLKQNPAQAAKKAIEVALSRGANLRDIVNDEFVPNLTLNAVQQLIDQKLSPLVGNLQQRQGVETEQAQAQEQARMKSAQFLADYPDAEVHSEVVADQMRKIMADYSQRNLQLDPYIAAEMAWNGIRTFAEKNQLDINQPLGPQYQARQTRPATQQQAVPQRRPMPNGSNAPMQTRSNLAKPDDSYRSIVKQALIESGYNLS